MARGDDLVLKVSADTSTVAAGLKPMTTALDSIGAEADDATKSLERLESEVSDLGHKRVEIDVRQEALDKARARVDALRDEIAQGVVLDMDTRAAQRELSTLEKTIKQVLSRPPTVVEVDTADAEADVDRLAADIAEVHDKTVHLDVDVDREGVKGVEALREGVRETTTSITDLGSGLSGLSVLALAAIPALADLNETLEDMRVRNAEAGRANSGLLRSASAVTSFIGGPWGLALVAGGSLLAAFAQNQLEAEQASQQFTESINFQTGALDENNRKLVAKQLQDRGILETAEQLGLSTEDLTSAILGSEDAYSRLMARRQAVIEQSRVNGVADKQTLESLNSILNAQLEMGSALGTTATAQDLMGRAVGTTGKAVEAQAGAVEETTGVWRSFSEQLDTAHTELDGLIASLDGLNARLGDSRAAQGAYEESVSDLNEALAKSTHTLDLSKAAGRANDELIRQQAANIVALRDARLRDAAATGESTDKILAEYGKQRDALDRTATKLGGNTKFAQTYVDTLLAAPDEVSTEVEVLGIEEGEKKINKMARDRETSIDVEVNLNTNLARFNRLPQRVRDAISGNGSVNLDVAAQSSAAPAPSTVFMSPRLYLDSRPIRAALRGDVETVVSSTLATTTGRRRM